MARSRRSMMVMGGGKWTPMKLPSLRLYLDGDNISGNDGDAVASWVSEDSASVDFTQATEGYKPLLKTGANGISGHSVVLFDGSDDFLASSVFDSSESGTVFVILRLTDPVQDRQIVFASADANANANFCQMLAYYTSTNPNPLIHSDVATTTNAVRGDSVIASNTVYLMTFRSTGTSWTVRVNGINQSLTVVAGANNGNWFGDSASRDNFTLGARYANSGTIYNPLKGAIASLIYCGDISDTQLYQSETWLARRYGLSLPPFELPLPNPDAAVAANAGTYLSLPTYDSSEQAVHPSVVDAGAGNWNGYRYWMGVTPYPGGNDQYENPSIMASADKTTWIVPAGLTNPLADPPAGGHNADPALLLDDGTLYCYWLCGDPVNEIQCRTSTDGVTWTAMQTVLTGAFETIISPSICKIGSIYYLWVVDASSGVNTLIRYSADNPLGPFANQVTCTGSNSWHFAVIYSASDSCYFAYGTTSVYGQLYVSADGLAWYQKSTYLLNPSAPGGWDHGGVYAGSLVRVAGGFDLWYSGNDGGAPIEWRVGYTAVTGI